MKKLIVIVALLMAGVASANKVAIKDNANVMSAGQYTSLLAETSRWPFELRVVTNTYSSKAALEQAVHQCVNSPNVVCVGLDPTHHGVRVHFGTGTGVRPSDFNLIAAAGNSFFKSNDWLGGIESIADRALESARSSQVVNVGTQQQPVQVHVDMPRVVHEQEPVSAGWWIFAFVMVALVVGAIILAIRSARNASKTVKKVNEDMNDFRDEAFEMSSRNMEERDFHEKMKAKGVFNAPANTPALTTARPVVTPVAPAHVSTPVTTAPTTVVVQGNNNNDLLTGVLIGQALNNNPHVVECHTVEVVRNVEREREVVHTRRDDDDNGGSGLSWGSSSSDSNSSSDSGGSSSDWGSSSSSDSSSSWDSGSSGGGDSGGGGSDW